MRLNKHLAAMTIVLAGSCGMVAWQTSNAGPQDAPPTTQPAKQAVNKFCAVERDDKVDPAVTVEYNAKTIAFCCKDCVAKFKADPDKFMKDLK